jgi:dihydrodipicolinate synthase/N-acetylneuraminate lyase
VLAGAATEAEITSVRLARELGSAGADGLVIPLPLTAATTQSKLARYFEVVAGATDLPVMIRTRPSSSALGWA